MKDRAFRHHWNLPATNEAVLFAGSLTVFSSFAACQLTRPHRPRASRSFNELSRQSFSAERLPQLLFWLQRQPVAKIQRGRLHSILPTHRMFCVCRGVEFLQTTLGSTATTRMTFMPPTTRRVAMTRCAVPCLAALPFRQQDRPLQCQRPPQVQCQLLAPRTHLRRCQLPRLR
jgi:hypothetical protein